MGNEYANFMTKKSFHPGSYANRLKTSDAEAKAQAKLKHDQETLAQYQKEQELYNQKGLISKESKDKLSLNFMYELPPGMKKPDDQKQSEANVEWKGSSSSKPAKHLEIMPKPSVSSSKTSDSETNICLEWKRQKPVSKKAQLAGMSSNDSSIATTTNTATAFTITTLSSAAQAEIPDKKPIIKEEKAETDKKLKLELDIKPKLEPKSETSRHRHKQGSTERERHHDRHRHRVTEDLDRHRKRHKHHHRDRDRHHHSSRERDESTKRIKREH